MPILILTMEKLMVIMPLTNPKPRKMSACKKEIGSAGVFSDVQNVEQHSLDPAVPACMPINVMA